MNSSVKIYTGPRGGQYIIENGKKKYIRKSSSKKKTKESEPLQPILERSSRKKTCCCCGKELSRLDTEYYDLTDYCAKCALADGILSSLD